jgi:hypothetical protein
MMTMGTMITRYGTVAGRACWAFLLVTHILPGFLFGLVCPFPCFVSFVNLTTHERFQTRCYGLRCLWLGVTTRPVVLLAVSGLVLWGWMASGVVTVAVLYVISVLCNLSFCFHLQITLPSSTSSMLGW